MRIALAGTRSFGAAVLQRLADVGIDIGFVVAPPGDKTAKKAANLGLECVPEINPEAISKARVDLIVCAHTHAFIGRRTRDAATLGAIGYHPSLLPRHRGRDAVRWTVHMNDPVAGGTVYWLTENIDAGPIETQKHVHVGAQETYSELWRDKLFPLGVELLTAAVLRVAEGHLHKERQDEEYATWEPSWDRAPLWRPELPQIGPMPEGYSMHHKKV